MRNDPTIDVLYPNALILGDVPEAGREYMEMCSSEGEVTFERLINQQCIVMCCVTARRDSIIRAGMFDETLRCSEDFDMWLRIIKQGGRIAYHRQVLARYRRRGGSHTADPIWLCHHVMRVLDKARRTMELTASERAAVDQQYRGLQALLRHSEGKKAFFSGDVEGAIEALTEANSYLKSRKIGATLFLLRRAPHLLLRAYDLRDRFVFKSSTRI